MNKSILITRNCEYCKKEYKTKSKGLQTIRHCSKKCQYKTHSKFLTGLKGNKNYNWKGGRIKWSNGYTRIYKPEHPNSDYKGYIFEHRLIMEKAMRRYLFSNETVHHKNGIKDDNRIENLELVKKPFHLGEIECPYCLKKFKIQ